MLMWHQRLDGAALAAKSQQKCVASDTAVSEGAKPLTALAIVVGLGGAARKDRKWYCSFMGSLAVRNVRLSACGRRPARNCRRRGIQRLTYLGLLAIPNRYIFSVTSWLIALLAAGMAAQSVQFLNNAGLVVALDHTVWDTSWLLSEGSIFGRMLHALIGYTERPTEMQLVVYICILIAMFVLHAGRACAAPQRPGRRRIVCQRLLPPSVAKATSGALSISLSRARAGPRGWRLPCSQLRTVSIGTSILFGEARPA